MMKTTFLLILIAFSYSTFAQQFSLYNSRTLFDAFENPSQKAFQVDSSHKYAFNFFIPTIAINASYSGTSRNAVKAALNGFKINTDDIAIGSNKMNTIVLNANAYIAMFRVFTDVKHNREMGFSWQIRNDGRIRASNETLAIFNNYNLFTGDQYNFNNNGYNQAYHQISYAYRKDYNKRLSFGMKLSALSGILYNDLKLDQALLNIDQEGDSIFLKLKGTYRSSYKFSQGGKYLLYPKIKNPGMSVGLSTSYKFKNNWFLLANLKDIGFIKWNKNSYVYNFDNTISIGKASTGLGMKLSTQIKDMIDGSTSQDKFTTITNGKAELLLNKNFNNYRPNFIISKNLFNSGGDIALVHNFLVRNFVFTASTDYNLENNLQIGGQIMLKTPNTELFFGSDQLLQTYNTLSNSVGGPANIGASFYMGFALKFGPAMENPQNANTIPGMEDTNTNFSGLIRRIFSRN